MIDVFTIVLIVLLQNYSVSEFKLTPPKDIQLPKSTSQKDPVVSIVIIATKEAITIDGKRIVSIIDNTINKNDLKEEIIVSLFNELKEKKKVTQYKEALQAQYTPGPQNVILQADKSLPFSLIRKIMYTATTVGYPLFQFAVLKVAG